MLGLFSAGVLKGVTGIGYSTCALPMLVMAVGLPRAMALIVIPAIVSNFSLMWSTGGMGDAVRRFWRFYAAIVPGIAVGAVLLKGIDAQVAIQFLGGVTLLYVGIAVMRPNLSLDPAFERLLAVPAGLANGVLTGLTGSQIMPLMPYMMALRLSAAEQVQAINLAVVLASLVLGGALLIAGHVHWEILVFSVLGTVPAVMGVDAGSRVRSRLSTQGFRHATLAMLAVLGVALTVQSGKPDATVCARANSEASAPLDRPCLSAAKTISRH
ncbi:MAG: sulfite exporter TauE/SafE family protein [Hyphomicrobiaceae bacterium]